MKTSTNSDASGEVEYGGEFPGQLGREHTILLGMQACGKSTLVSGIPELSDGYVSLGQICRSLDPDSKEKKYLDRIFASGKPSGEATFFIDLIAPPISQRIAEGRGYVLDGIPKKYVETDPLLDYLGSIGASPTIVLCCDIDVSVARERFLARPQRVGESDDVAIFEARTHTYMTDMPSIIEALEGATADFLVVNMDGSPEEVVGQVYDEYAKIRKMV